MKIIFSIVTLLITFSAYAQTEIKLEDIKDHIGDSVKLIGKIYGGKYIKSIKGFPTFLDVGGKYPNAPLTLVIWGEVRKQFKTPPEEIYNKGYEEWIVGKIVLYKDEPEIVITNPGQIYDVVGVPVSK